MDKHYNYPEYQFIFIMCCGGIHIVWGITSSTKICWPFCIWQRFYAERLDWRTQSNTIVTFRRKKSWNIWLIFRRYNNKSKSHAETYCRAFEKKMLDSLTSSAVNSYRVPKLFPFFAAKPSSLNFADARRRLVEIDGVEGVHSLRIWSLTTGVHVITVHLVIGMIRKASTR